jgi:hypothetical protein
MWCCSDIVALSIDGVAATLSLCQVLCLGMWLARPYQGHLHRYQHYRLVVIPSDSVACMIALLHTWLVAASRAFAFTVWCWGLVLGCGVGVWCWGLVLGSGVGVWCWGLVLGSGVGVWCWGLVCCDCMRLDAFIAQYGWQARKMPWE